MGDNWRINENVEGYKPIYRHNMSQDRKLGQRKHV